LCRTGAVALTPDLLGQQALELGGTHLVAKGGAKGQGGHDDTVVQSHLAEITSAIGHKSYLDKQLIDHDPSELTAINQSTAVVVDHSDDRHLAVVF